MPHAAAHMLDVQFGQASDFGKVRTNNEDAMGSFIPASRQQARSHGFLFVVADGVGGMDLGEVASATAVSVMTDEFAKAQSGSMLISLLPRLIQHANAAVHDRTLQPEYRGKKMATTLVACALRYDQAIVSHVGDSRCYLVRNGQARQITQDHTLVNEQRKMGLISAGEIATSDARHVLIRSRRAGDVCLSRHHCAHPAAGRCAGAVHRRTARRDGRSRDRLHRLAKERRRRRSPASWSPARSKSTAATTPRRR